ncbi:MAG TPA: hypothetical protein VJ731_01220, partial [Terriglobales bacterium]|nr:hypothetical protein [Terriglobales bacterium]
MPQSPAGSAVGTCSTCRRRTSVARIAAKHTITIPAAADLRRTYPDPYTGRVVVGFAPRGGIEIRRTR